MFRKIIESLIGHLDISDEGDILCERKFEQRKIKNGVPPEAWTPEDRNRLVHGQKPVGHPEHPNV